LRELDLTGVQMRQFRWVTANRDDTPRAEFNTWLQSKASPL